MDLIGALIDEVAWLPRCELWGHGTGERGWKGEQEGVREHACSFPGPPDERINQFGHSPGTWADITRRDAPALAEVYGRLK